MINTTSNETQLSIKFILLKTVKMPTFVGILTFISMINNDGYTKQWNSTEC